MAKSKRAYDLPRFVKRVNEIGLTRACQEQGIPVSTMSVKLKEAGYLKRIVFTKGERNATPT